MIDHLHIDVDCATDRRFLLYIPFLARARFGDDSDLDLWVQACAFQQMMAHEHARTCHRCLTDFPPCIVLDSQTLEYTSRVARRECDVCGSKMTAAESAGWHDAMACTVDPEYSWHQRPGFLTATPRIVGENLNLCTEWKDVVSLARRAFDVGLDAPAVRDVIVSYEEELYQVRELFYEHAAVLQRAMEALDKRPAKGRGRKVAAPC